VGAVALYRLGKAGTDEALPYQPVPVDTALDGCRGYWAYFPTGGSIRFSNEGAGNCVVEPQGQFVLIGNNVPTATAHIVGADAAYSYTAPDGYHATTSIPPGYAVWVFGSGLVTLDFTSALPVPASYGGPSAIGADRPHVSGALHAGAA
jgi:hypothetical protein